MSGTPAASGSLRAALSYCVQQVRSYDYHHYLCLLHLAPSMRKAAFTFRAFNVETAKAMDVVSDPKKGLMRLLWWKDVIDKIFANKLVEHPVARALSSVVSEHKISKHWLKRSVEARINDANRDEYAIPETTAELERYAEDTQSTILYMTLQAGGIQSTIADHAASHIGKASGLLLLLKSLPHHVNKQGTIPYIPASVAEECSLLTREGGRSEVRMGDELPDAVFKVASVADAHLHKARELASSVPREAVPVLLPAVPAQALLDSLQRHQFNVLDSRLSRGVHGISPLWYQLKLNWHAWRNRLVSVGLSMPSGDVGPSSAPLVTREEEAQGKAHYIASALPNKFRDHRLGYTVAASPADGQILSVFSCNSTRSSSFPGRSLVDSHAAMVDRSPDGSNTRRLTEDRRMVPWRLLQADEALPVLSPQFRYEPLLS